MLAVCLLVVTFAACGSMAEQTAAEAEAAQTQTSVKEIKTGEITTVAEAEKAGDCDIVGVDCNVVQDIRPAALRKLLDGGTILVIRHVDGEVVTQIAEALQVVYAKAKTTDLQTTIGACLRKRSDGAYLLSEIVAEIAKPRFGKKVTTPEEDEAQEELRWLEEEAEIDLLRQYYQIEGEEMRFAALQEEMTLDSDRLRQWEEERFAEASVYYYLYAERSLLSIMQTCMYAFNTKTDGDSTIDTFTADFTISAQKNLKIRTFRGELATPEEARYNVLHASQLDSDSVWTVRLGLSVNGVKLSRKSACKAGGLDIVNQLFQTAYLNQWEAKPASPEKNATYTISPEMIVEVADGVRTAAEVRAALPYLDLRKSWIRGWVADEDKGLTIKYKDHLVTM